MRTKNKIPILIVKFKEKNNHSIFKIEENINEKLKILISLFVNMIFIKYKDLEKTNKNERIFLLDKKLIETFSEEIKTIKKLYYENLENKIK